MPTLQDIKNQIVSQASEQGLKSGALYEFEGNRWACLGWTSYGGGQGLDFVKEGGDYQVAISGNYIKYVRDGQMSETNAHWLSGFKWGYTRVIVKEVSTSGTKLLRVSDWLDNKCGRSAISQKFHDDDHFDEGPNPEEFIPFDCFERLDDRHLEFEQRAKLQLSELRPLDQD